MKRLGAAYFPTDLEHAFDAKWQEMFGDAESVPANPKTSPSTRWGGAKKVLVDLGGDGKEEEFEAREEGGGYLINGDAVLLPEPLRGWTENLRCRRLSLHYRNGAVLMPGKPYGKGVNILAIEPFDFDGVDDEGRAVYAGQQSGKKVRLDFRTGTVSNEFGVKLTALPI
jgi:hypothetical protein